MSALVTSDISAGGVDYPGVMRVIQLGVPSSGDVYCVGQTGCVGGSGSHGMGDGIPEKRTRRCRPEAAESG